VVQQGTTLSKAVGLVQHASIGTKLSVVSSMAAHDTPPLSPGPSPASGRGEQQHPGTHNEAVGCLAANAASHAQVEPERSVLALSPLMGREQERGVVQQGTTSSRAIGLIQHASIGTKLLVVSRSGSIRYAVPSPPTPLPHRGRGEPDISVSNANVSIGPAAHHLRRYRQHQHRPHHHARGQQVHAGVRALGHVLEPAHRVRADEACQVA